MIRTLLCTGALLVSAPALAQQQTTPQPADPAATAPAQQTPATPDQGAAAGAQQAQPQAAAPTDIASIVDSEFPTYDADKSGQLEKTEFAKWMGALKDQEAKATGQAQTPEQVTAWTNGAFSTADTNKDGVITKEELVKFLSGGA